MSFEINDSVESTSNILHQVEIRYDLVKLGRGQYEVKVKATTVDYHNIAFHTSIHTSDSSFVDSIIDLNVDGLHQEAQQLYHDKFFRSFEEDLAEWLGDLDREEVGDELEY